MKISYRRNRDGLPEQNCSREGEIPSGAKARIHRGLERHG
jgi:hypothetical protein